MACERSAIALLSIAIALSATACAPRLDTSGVEVTVPDYAPAVSLPQTPTPPPAELLALSEPGRAGGYLVWIADTKALPEGVDKDTLAPGSKWLAVQLEVRQVSDEADWFDYRDFSLAGTGASTIPLTDSGLASIESTAPGSSSVRGWIAVQIPSDDADLLLVYSPPSGPRVGWDLNKRKTDEEIEAAAEEMEYDRSTVDLEEYKAIKAGMTARQVSKLVGWKGEEMASGYGSEMRVWQNEDGSNMLVTFQNGKVVAKAQAGL